MTEVARLVISPKSGNKKKSGGGKKLRRSKGFQQSLRAKRGLGSKAGKRAGTPGGSGPAAGNPTCGVCRGAQIMVKCGPIFEGGPSVYGVTYQHDLDIHKAKMSVFNAEASAAFAAWTTEKLKLAQSWKKAIKCL